MWWREIVKICDGLSSALGNWYANNDLRLGTDLILCFGWIGVLVMCLCEIVIVVCLICLKTNC